MAKTTALPPPDKIFAGKVFVLQGDFGRYPRTHLNIARLIERHGGRVDSMVTDRTTLLVTTIEEFRKRTPASKFAFISVSLLLSDPLTFACSSREGYLIGKSEMQNRSMGICWRFYFHKEWETKSYLGEFSWNSKRAKEAKSPQRGKGNLQEEILSWCQFYERIGRSR